MVRPSTPLASILSPLPFLLFTLFWSCGEQGDAERPAPVWNDYAASVNVFTGTSKMGHTHPGATVPWGFVQVVPQTAFEPVIGEDGAYNPKTYEYCAGYQHGDSTMIGFAHTAFSGTGHSDLGDLLMMPVTGDVSLEAPDLVTGTRSLASGFRHETGSPGAYAVELTRYGIQSEVTATERVGVHRHTYPGGEEAGLVLDLGYNIYHHDEKNLWTFVRVENDTTLVGWRMTQGWARTRQVHFAIRLSEPLQSWRFKRHKPLAYNGFYRRFAEETTSFPEFAGRDVRCLLSFGPLDRPLEVKVALSAVDAAGALANLEAEAAGQTLSTLRTAARHKWNAALSRVEAECLTEADRTTFYTALYHTLLMPTVYEDVDGRYRGLDGLVHESAGFVNHTVFSVWDTFRAFHPWMNLAYPEKSADFVASMLAHADESVHGMLPVWSHHGNENWCMIGYHAVSVLADAAAKDIEMDTKRALEACLTTSTVRHFDGLGDRLDLGYFPDDRTHSSVSKTLEIAYDDWCIAQLAEQLGHSDIAAEYTKRSLAHRQHWKDGFMRPKRADGSFRSDFDPLDTHGQGFIEGNAWTYSLFAPHDIDHLIDLHGGQAAFVAHLDSLFTMSLDDKYFAATEDITRDGIVGNYVHGNEPGHHIPYLYNFAGQPARTQAQVRALCANMYGPGVDGLCGNDDAGQMSAWYLFSSLGFYPVAPGFSTYAIGSPSVRSARLALPNGNTLTIETTGQSPEAVYVDEVTLNGRPVDNYTLTHSELTGGGTLRFVMREGGKR